jgi:hypothetical protein
MAFSQQMPKTQPLNILQDMDYRNNVPGHVSNGRIYVVLKSPTLCRYLWAVAVV